MRPARSSPINPANDGWEQFLARIEASDSTVRVLGITDYYSTATYQQALACKAAGRMRVSL